MCWDFDRDVYQLYVDFRQAYDSILRDKLYDIMLGFRISTKLVNLTKMTMTETLAHVTVQNKLTKPFELTEGLNQVDGLPLLLFHLSLEYAIRKTSVDRLGVLYYKSVQIAAYADDIATITRSSAAAREPYLNLKINTKDAGLSINVYKTKMISQTIYPLSLIHI